MRGYGPAHPCVSTGNSFGESVLSSSIALVRSETNPTPSSGPGYTPVVGSNGAAPAPSLAAYPRQPRTVLRSSTDPSGNVTGQVQLTCGPEHSPGNSNPGAASAPSQSLLASGCCHNSFAAASSTSCEIMWDSGWWQVTSISPLMN